MTLGRSTRVSFRLRVRGVHHWRKERGREKEESKSEMTLLIRSRVGGKYAEGSERVRKCKKCRNYCKNSGAGGRKR